MKQQQHIIYWGRVQGVGFRATAQRLAQGFPLAGFVKNLPNGSVELAVEGDALQVAEYLQRLAERFAGQVERVEELPAVTLNWTGFRIRYD